MYGRSPKYGTFVSVFWSFCGNQSADHDGLAVLSDDRGFDLLHVERLAERH